MEEDPSPKEPESIALSHTDNSEVNKVDLANEVADKSEGDANTGGSYNITVSTTIINFDDGDGDSEDECTDPNVTCYFQFKGGTLPLHSKPATAINQDLLPENDNIPLV